MQLQGETDDLGFCLSFSCYFSDSNLTASAAAKVICELKQEQAPQFYDFSDVDEEEFEFSSDLSYEQVSGKQINDFTFVFPVSDGAIEETGDAASPVSVQLHKSSVNEQESYSSSSFSYSEANEDECDSKPSGMFCFAKCKKSCYTGGSGSHGLRRWRILKSLCWSNSEGEDAVKVSGKLKKTSSSASPSFHEVFYVQKRAKQKGDKMKSFLPYKQDLLGFFVSINKFGNKKL
ncbi:hypothetical protein HanOQP8_Chr09g0335581 [Helianthus annuus]|nr:hypothetical protein HanOQP8_Chr09g0335581 [Helianthus annuus]